MNPRLAPFIGTWTTAGQQLDGPVGPAGPITATETFEWLEGGRFVIHRFRGTIGDKPAACIEVIGHHAESDTFPVHTFYDDGTQNEWRYTNDDRTWVLTGTWKSGSVQPMKVRCTTVFDPSGDAMVTTWSSAGDDGAWHAFWEVRSTRAR